MYSGAGDTTQLMSGSPIRTPWDHSSVDNSPRPIAASHVLHRLLVPRHPPSALSNLTTKMLASTVQFSTNNHPHHSHTTRPQQVGPVLCADEGDHPEQIPSNRTELVLSGPNRVFTPSPAAPTHSTPQEPKPSKLYSRRPLPKKASQCLRR
jgi:hypothetical protein